MIAHFCGSFGNRLKLKLPVANVVISDELEGDVVINVGATADNEYTWNASPVLAGAAIPNPKEHGPQFDAIIAVFVIIH